MTRGMVVAPQPEAVEAGAVALMEGGNAVDAAVACALVQTVVDPCMAGIAGFGSAHLYLPGEGVHGILDFHARAPAAVTEDMWAERIEGEYRDGFGFRLRDRANEIGYQSIMVPGSLAAWHEAATAHGRLPWADLVAPAIRYAREGFMVRPHMVEFWTKRDFGRVSTREKLALTPAGRRLFFDERGELKRVGDRIVNEDFAATLERIARGGAEVFQRGDLARESIADLRAHGALITEADLAGYRTRRAEPLWCDYRGHRVASNPPPGGGVVLLEMLNVLGHFDLAALGHNTSAYIRVVAEAMKVATADKDALVGDPDFVDVPLERLLGAAYAHEVAARIRAGRRHHVERLREPEESRETTHVSVVDDEGNAVSMTHSLGMPSGVITDGLGFMWNGCMGVFDPRTGRAGSLAPGKSRFTAMCPTIAFRDGAPAIVVGAPGGTWITMGVLQALVNVVDFGMSMSDAVAAPRFTANSDVIDVCNRIPRFVTAELEGEGYPVARSPLSYTFAGVHGIRVRDGRWEGGADPGRDGMALAV